MLSSEIPADSPASLLFPQFKSELYLGAASEVEGLNEDQLNFESDRWGWSGWSIRRQLSHIFLLYTSPRTRHKRQARIP